MQLGAPTDDEINDNLIFDDVTNVFIILEIAGVFFGGGQLGVKAKAEGQLLSCTPLSPLLLIVLQPESIEFLL